MAKQGVSRRSGAGQGDYMGKRHSKAGGRKKAPRKQPDILTEAEIRALKAKPNTRCPTGLRNRCMLELMHRSGLRVCEITGLCRPDIRWSERMVEIKRGKGGEPRTVPLLDSTLEWLARWDERRPRGEHFFCTLRKTKLHHSYIRELVKRLGSKAGIEGLHRVHPHALRHSFATECLRRGMNIREVQELLGHKDVRTTQIYLSVRPEELAERFRQVMGAPPAPGL
ncbi:MAG: tyrosine-type recombinase/integrase [Candidatus Brocadiae bacterium]|nr:tyrosine-type recombinase/integrase [Candidatus Brocadiia bacterium]